MDEIFINLNGFHDFAGELPLYDPDGEPMAIVSCQSGVLSLVSDNSHKLVVSGEARFVGLQLHVAGDIELQSSLRVDWLCVKARNFMAQNALRCQESIDIDVKESAIFAATIITDVLDISAVDVQIDANVTATDDASIRVSGDIFLNGCLRSRGNVSLLAGNDIALSETAAETLRLSAQHTLIARRRLFAQKSLLLCADVLYQDDALLAPNGYVKLQANQWISAQASTLTAKHLAFVGTEATLGGVIEASQLCHIYAKTKLTLAGQIKGRGLFQMNAFEIHLQSGASLRWLHDKPAVSSASRITAEKLQIEDKASIQLQVSAPLLAIRERSYFFHVNVKTATYTNASLFFCRCNLTGNVWRQIESPEKNDTSLVLQQTYFEYLTVLIHHGDINLDKSFMKAKHCHINERASGQFNTSRMEVHQLTTLGKVSFAATHLDVKSWGSLGKAELDCFQSTVKAKKEVRLESSASLEHTHMVSTNISINGQLCVKNTALEASELFYMTLTDFRIIPSLQTTSQSHDSAKDSTQAIYQLRVSTKTARIRAALQAPSLALSRLLLQTDDLICDSNLVFVDSFILAKLQGQQLLSSHIHLDNTQFVTDGGLFNDGHITLSHGASIKSSADNGLFNFGNLEMGHSSMTAKALWHDGNDFQASQSTLIIAKDLKVHAGASFELASKTSLLASKAVVSIEGELSLSDSEAHLRQLLLTEAGSLTLSAMSSQNDFVGVSVKKSAWLQGELRMTNTQFIAKDVQLNATASLTDAYMVASSMTIRDEATLTNSSIKTDALTLNSTARVALTSARIQAKRLIHRGQMTIAPPKLHELDKKPVVPTYIETSYLETQSGSLISGDALCMETGDWQHSGTVRLFSLQATGNTLFNEGRIEAKDSLYFGYDTGLWNAGMLSSRSISIEAGILANTGGMIEAHTLNTAALVDVNLAGIICAYNGQRNSLLALDAGLTIPNLTRVDDIFTRETFKQVGLSFGRQALSKVPILGTGVAVAEQGYRLYQSSAALWDLINDPDPKTHRAHKYIGRTLGVASAAQGFYGATRSFYGETKGVWEKYKTWEKAQQDAKQGAEIKTENQEMLPNSGASSNPSPSAWPSFDEAKSFAVKELKDVTYQTVKGLGPSSNTNSVLHMDAGARLGFQSQQSSWASWHTGLDVAWDSCVNSGYYTNSGARVAWHSSERTYTSANYGVDIARGKDIHTQSYHNYGLLQARQGKCEASQSIHNMGTWGVGGEGKSTFVIQSPLFHNANTGRFTGQQARIVASQFSQEGTAYFNQSCVTSNDACFSLGAYTTLQDSQLHASQVNDAGTLQSVGQSGIVADDYQHTGYWQARDDSQDALFFLQAQSATLAGGADVNRAAVSIDHMTDFTDFLLKRGAYTSYVIDELTGETLDPILLQNVGRIGRGLSVIAPTVGVTGTYLSDFHLGLRSTDGDMSVDGEVTAASIALYSAVDLRLKGKVKGHDYVAGHAQRDLLIDCTQTRAEDGSERYAPSEVRGGKGLGNEGYGVDLGAEGRAVNDASTLVSEGSNRFAGKKGVEHKARTWTQTLAPIQEKSWLGASKTKTTGTTSYTLRPTMRAGKRNIMTAAEGGIIGEAACIEGHEDNTLMAQQDIAFISHIEDVKAQESTKVLWFIPWSSTKIGTQQETPTEFLTGGSGKTQFKSEAGDITLRGTNAHTDSCEFEVSPDNKVEIERTKLQHTTTKSRTSVGWRLNRPLRLSLRRVDEVKKKDIAGAGDMVCRESGVKGGEFRQLQGAALRASGNSHLNVTRMHQTAMALHETSYVRQVEVHLGLNPFNGFAVHAGASYQSASTEKTTYLNASHTTQSTLKANIKTLTQEGGNIRTGAIQGRIDAMRSTSLQDEVTEKSFGVAADTLGNMSAHMRYHHSLQTESPSGLKVDAPVNPAEFSIGEAELTAAHITGQGAGTLKVDSIISHSVQDSVSTIGGGVDINICQVFDILSSNSEAPLASLIGFQAEYTDIRADRRGVVSGMTVETDNITGDLYTQDAQGCVLQRNISEQVSGYLPILNVPKMAEALTALGVFAAKTRDELTNQDVVGLTPTIVDSNGAPQSNSHATSAATNNTPSAMPAFSPQAVSISIDPTLTTSGVMLPSIVAEIADKPCDAISMSTPLNTDALSAAQISLLHRMQTQGYIPSLRELDALNPSLAPTNLDTPTMLIGVSSRLADVPDDALGETLSVFGTTAGLGSALGEIGGELLRCRPINADDLDNFQSYLWAQESGLALSESAGTFFGRAGTSLSFASAIHHNPSPEGAFKWGAEFFSSQSVKTLALPAVQRACALLPFPWNVVSTVASGYVIDTAVGSIGDKIADIASTHDPEAMRKIFDINEAPYMYRAIHYSPL